MVGGRVPRIRVSIQNSQLTIMKRSSYKALQEAIQYCHPPTTTKTPKPLCNCILRTGMLCDACWIHAADDALASGVQPLTASPPSNPNTSNDAEIPATCDLNTSGNHTPRLDDDTPRCNLKCIETTGDMCSTCISDEIAAATEAATITNIDSHAPSPCVCTTFNTCPTCIEDYTLPPPPPTCLCASPNTCDLCTETEDTEPPHPFASYLN